MKQTPRETLSQPFPQAHPHQHLSSLSPLSYSFDHALRSVPASPLGEAMGSTGGWVGTWWFLAAAPGSLLFSSPASSFSLVSCSSLDPPWVAVPSRVSLLQCGSPTATVPPRNPPGWCASLQEPSPVLSSAISPSTCILLCLLLCPLVCLLSCVLTPPRMYPLVSLLTFPHMSTLELPAPAAPPSPTPARAVGLEAHLSSHGVGVL